MVEQHAEQRVAWGNTDGKHNGGVVTFHKIDDGTTRVAVQMDFAPEGLNEKPGNALEGRPRAVRGVHESSGYETGARLGEVRAKAD